VQLAAMPELQEAQRHKERGRMRKVGCPACQGTGKVRTGGGKDCSWCNGTGEIPLDDSYNRSVWQISS